MEKIKNSILEKKDLEKIKNDIKSCIIDFCIENNIENLKEETQNIYSAFCMYCGRRLFIENFFVIGEKNNIFIYDLFLIDQLSDLYIFTTKLQNKIVSLRDFSYFVNIDYNIIKGWKNEKLIKTETAPDQLQRDIRKYYYNINNSIDNYNIYIKKMLQAPPEIITAIKAAIYQKMHIEREENAKNILLSNKNPVGVISVVNHDFKWNIETIKEETRTRALTLQELPQLTSLCKPELKNDV